MKKNLSKLLFLISCLTVTLGGCKKDSKTENTIPKTIITATTISDKLKVDTVPRAVSYNSIYNAGPPESYTGSFHGCNFSISSIYWNSSMYPNLVDGVPLFGSVGATDNGCDIEYYNTSEGTVFTATLATLVSNGGASNQFHSDLEKYFNAVTAFQKGGSQGSMPSLFSYVKSNYGTASSTPGSTGPSGPASYTGKLIRITTGSNVAIGEVNYPLPGNSSNTIQNAYVDITDPINSNVLYHLTGTKGTITAAVLGYYSNNGYTLNYTNTPIVANGSYNYVGYAVHASGTIIRQDDSSFNYSILVDNR